jgi:cell division GTPase FtsZ
MLLNNTNSQSNQKLQTLIPVHFIGLGGAGSNMIKSIFDIGVKGKYTYISDFKKLNFEKEIEFMPYVSPGKRIIKNNIEIYKEVDYNKNLVLTDSIKKIFLSNNLFILLSGLGGYTGTFMTEKLSEFLVYKKKEFVVISTLPFSFEDTERKFIAEKSIKILQKLENFYSFELENYKKEFGNLKLDSFFEKIHYDILITTILPKIQFLK